MCEEMNSDYFKFRNKIINSSIYDIIKDIAPTFNETMGLCSSPLDLNMGRCSEIFTLIWTGNGLC